MEDGGSGFGGVSASKSFPTGTASNMEDIPMSWGLIGDGLRAAVMGLRLKDLGLLNAVRLMEGLLLVNKSLALVDLSGVLERLWCFGEEFMLAGDSLADTIL